ncbi:hypothetical protein [Halolamina salina]|uniref:DUF8124 domain-containing protein n=1 Tax=Halolamina salina TaxID=1220023 RepID=A0ABD6B8Z6_9EURY
MSDDADGTDEAREGDTFGVGIRVTESELRVVVRVPSDIDSGWTDPDSFQGMVEQVLWERLDQEETLQAIAATTEPGETTMLGTVTLRPDGTVVESSLAAPSVGE